MSNDSDRTAEVISWVDRDMPVMRVVRERLGSTAPLTGRRLSANVHLLPSTVPLLLALRDAGADLVVCGSNPMSTDPGVARWLDDQGMTVFAPGVDDLDDDHARLLAALDHNPHFILDEADGLLGLLHAEREELVPTVLGASVHTLTGVRRLHRFAEQGHLRFPVIGIDGSPIKQLFDNEMGTAQSTLDAISRLVNPLYCGSCAVVAGFGACGRGIAKALAHRGADVIVTEVDPVRALWAVTSGFRVMPADEAAAVGELFITATGNVNVFTRSHFDRMKDGATLVNAGHGNVEIDVASLADTASETRTVLPLVTEYRDSGGHRKFLLAEGYPVNTAASPGHPQGLMDISFAAQALGIEYLVENASRLSATVHSLPAEVQQRIAGAKLAALEVSIDRQDLEQQQYDERLSFAPR
ncbi:adenosylhomocysteinase [Actinosynnema sp. NPDC053489]|uniref:adenosylhomocysteinase n=1 Tax=Actinosynnema sp. NPDC053489 TaxID=3363916 RepID=UPI0037CA9AFB